MCFFMVRAGLLGDLLRQVNITGFCGVKGERRWWVKKVSKGLERQKNNAILQRLLYRGRCFLETDKYNIYRTFSHSAKEF